MQYEQEENTSICLILIIIWKGIRALHLFSLLMFPTSPKPNEQSNLKTNMNTFYGRAGQVYSYLNFFLFHGHILLIRKDLFYINITSLDGLDGGTQ